MGVRLAIFDCDGTLVDTEGSIVTAMQHAFESEGLESPSPKDVRRLVGLSLLESVRALEPELQSRQHEALVAAYREAYSELRKTPGFQQELFPGTLEILDLLRTRGILLGIATGKSRRGLDTTLELHGIRDHFATLQTADDAPSKPHPGMILNAMQETGSKPEHTVMLGDTSFDMQAAAQARTTGIGVAWGYHPRDELRGAGATLVIEDYSEFRAWLDEN